MKISNQIIKLLNTEKSISLKNSNVYVFKVSESATKSAIAEDIVSLYGVDVLSISSAIMPNKPKLTINSRKSGKRPQKIRIGRFKKAYIKIKPGQSIELGVSKEGK